MLRALLLIALAICWSVYGFAAEIMSDPNTVRHTNCFALHLPLLT